MQSNSTARTDARAPIPRLRQDRERRECRSCEGAGSVVLDADYDEQSGRLTQVIGECAFCAATGSVVV